MCLPLVQSVRELLFGGISSRDKMALHQTGLALAHPARRTCRPDVRTVLPSRQDVSTAILCSAGPKSVLYRPFPCRVGKAQKEGVRHGPSMNENSALQKKSVN
jgi:hypothetical protein